MLTDTHIQLQFHWNEDIKNKITKLTAKDKMKKKIVNDKHEKDNARTFHRPVPWVRK